jgi:hypothetical protein
MNFIKRDRLIDILLVKARLKSELIDYYESITIKIKSKFDQEGLNSSYDMILLKEKLLDKIEYVAMENLKEINNFFAIRTLNSEFLIKEEIKFNALKNYCIFIEENVFMDLDLKGKYAPGVLIVTDFYLDDYHQSFIK